MNIVITEKALFPVRRDKQTGASFTSGGGGGGGGSAASMGSGSVAITAADMLAKLLTVDGVASGLNADLLDDAEGALYARLASPTFTGDVTMPGTGIWNSSGNVGIGTTTPNYILEVNKGHAANIDDEIVLGSYYAGNLYGIGLNYRIDAVGSPSTHIVTHSGGSRTTAITLDSGKVGINGFTSPLSALCVNGGLHVGGESDAGDNNLFVVGLSQHPDFTSGWLGTNWQIGATGDAVFENLQVRGSARFRELIIDQLSVVGGSDLLSIARGKITSVDVANSKVTLEDPNGRGTSAFAVGDFFWIKSIDIDNATVNDCKGQIPVGGITGVTLTLDFTVTGHSGAITDINTGDVIVQRGHPTTVARQNLIYRTVSDTDNPFERYLSGVNSLAAFTNLANVVLQEGNLASLASYGILPATPGVGLYSNNVYLSGKIVLPTAGMTDEGALSTSIRIYAGDTYANRAIAPFRITQDGSLTAKGIAELGTSSIPLDGIAGSLAIKGCFLWENGEEDDSGIVAINYWGYQGGTDYYRNLIIYNGKHEIVIAVNGTSKSVEMTGALSVYGITTLNNTFNTTGAVDFSASSAINLGGAHVVQGSIYNDTCAVAISDITGFSKTITPKGNKIYVSFSIPIHLISVNQQWTMYIDKGGTNYYGVTSSFGGGVVVVNGSTIIDVTPNTACTVKIKWSDTTQVEYLGSTGTYGIGNLSIIDLM